jgi:hypothetical protein
MWVKYLTKIFELCGIRFFVGSIITTLLCARMVVFVAITKDIMAVEGIRVKSGTGICQKLKDGTEIGCEIQT